MSRATDATSDAGGDHRQVSVSQSSHSDAEVVGSNTGELKPNNYALADKDPKIGLTVDKPVDISDISSLDRPDKGAAEQAELYRPDEGTAEQAELVAWLTKLADADDCAFTASEQAEVRDEIKELRVQVGRLTELNRNQQEAIGQLLTEVQHGSERMGRKDWVTYAIGAATSLVIMEIVPPLVLLPLAVHAIHTLGPLFSILDA
jgi:hypothetical protein